MIRPFHVTTKAAVIASAGSKAASTACFTLAASSPAGSGPLGSTRPSATAVEGSGSRLFDVRLGVKLRRRLPSGSVTQPWSPR